MSEGISYRDVGLDPRSREDTHFVFDKRGVKTPDGSYFDLQGDEEFVFLRENGKREPYIRQKNGSLIQFENWKNQRAKKDSASVGHPLSAKLDRARLIAIVEKSQEPGARLGETYKLEKEDREQIEYAIKIAEDIVEKTKTDPRWQHMEKLIQKEKDKGSIMSFFDFPPNWLTYGSGENDFQILKDKNGRTLIKVPSDLYLVYLSERGVREIKNKLHIFFEKGRRPILIEETLSKVFLYVGQLIHEYNEKMESKKT